MGVGYMPTAMIKANGVMKINGTIHDEPPRLLVLFDQGQEEIAGVFANVLGYTSHVVGGLEGVNGSWDEVVVGLENDLMTAPETIRDINRTVITTHCIDLQDCRDEELSAVCDYEYLYTQSTLLRRDVSRFLAFVLGQKQPHEELSKKQRTTLLSTTFPDIRAALTNLDIQTVGADSVELRVDLLRDPSNDDAFGSVASLKYVGEQVMLLRQRTELPIIFTTRCTKENGRFPMHDPGLYYTYLRKALQWGCEYIDVELWLPEDIRRKLAAEKGPSKIISAWHDLSCTFKWTSPEALSIYKEGARYGDMVKMIALVNNAEENYELEYFRSTVQSRNSHPPFSGLNMGSAGQLSRTLNKVFTPITHPLLPMIAAPGQLSAAEINSMLHSLGHMPQLDMYAIGHVRENGHAMFLEKCLNELSLPHRLLSVDRTSHGSIEKSIRQSQFGGAYINPPLPVEGAPYLPTLTEAASAIGQVDTIAVRTTNSGRALIADNVSWKGIRATLTRDFVPSAYKGRSAVVIANTEAHAAAAIYALTSLDVGAIYTIGFHATGHKQLQGMLELDQIDEPFAVISGLPAEKSLAAAPVLKHYSRPGPKTSLRSGRIFIDLANGIKGSGDAVSVAAHLGWNVYACAESMSWTIVEMMRCLLGENVPYAFVRLAAGRGLYT